MTPLILREYLKQWGAAEREGAAAVSDVHSGGGNTRALFYSPLCLGSGIHGSGPLSFAIVVLMLLLRADRVHLSSDRTNESPESAALNRADGTEALHFVLTLLHEHFTIILTYHYR